ncbi:hypothetical protein LSAT2_022827 [Lamellibrachia satsuma]|nr:hypothetical protein LSAT2_022827 [Lamellibrachia satsuma]
MLRPCLHALLDRSAILPPNQTRETPICGVNVKRQQPINFIVEMVVKRSQHDEQSSDSVVPPGGCVFGVFRQRRSSSPLGSGDDGSGTTLMDDPTTTTATDIDACIIDPCENGATCNDGVNAYTCTCAAGYTGDRCETDIDECVSIPCKNGATCFDDVNGYSCNCAAGYTGDTCETEQHHFINNPAKHPGGQEKTPWRAREDRAARQDTIIGKSRPQQRTDNADKDCM